MNHYEQMDYVCFTVIKQYGSCPARLLDAHRYLCFYYLFFMFLTL